MKNQTLLLPLLTMIISGISVYANARLVVGLDPILQTTLKNGLVGLMILTTLTFTHKIPALKQLSAKNWLKLIIVSLVGGSLSFALFFTGLKAAGAVEGALIHKTMVFWIVILATRFLKEKLSPLMILGVIGLYASNFIGGAGFKTFHMAQILILAATLLWSVEAILVSKYLKDIDVDLLLFGRMGLGSGLLLIYMLFTGKAGLIQAVTAPQWQGIFLVSLLLFGYVMTWYRSLKYFSPVLVSSILVGSTIITTALSTTFSGRLTLNQLIQSLIVSGLISAIFLAGNRRLTKSAVQTRRLV